MTESRQPPKDWAPIRAVIADLDGVVYRGDSPIASAVEAFQHWQGKGIPCRFVTNNATKSAADFAAKLSRMGVAATPEQVVTSPAATARYMQQRFAKGTRVHVVGSQALRDVMTEAGFELADTDVKVVAVGLDQTITYAKIRTAVRALLAGAELIGTNADPRLPVEDGFDPGAGSILAAIATAGGVQPTVIGKPEVHMIVAALEDLGSAKAETIMIGDQVSTDIVAGHRARLRTVLVTTGIHDTGIREVEPDLIVDRLMDVPFG